MSINYSIGFEGHLFCPPFKTWVEFPILVVDASYTKLMTDVPILYNPVNINYSV